MAKITIGGVEYLIPELNFIALERVWPYVDAVTTTLNPMKAVSAGVAIIAAGLIEKDDFDETLFGMTEMIIRSDEVIFENVQHFLKKKLKASEIDQVTGCVNDILEEAGVVEKDPPPPPLGTEEESLSPEISPASSPSSSQPDVKQEAGTA